MERSRPVGSASGPEPLERKVREGDEAKIDESTRKDAGLPVFCGKR